MPYIFISSYVTMLIEEYKQNVNDVMMLIKEYKQNINDWTCKQSNKLA